MSKESNYFVPTLHITNFINEIYSGEKEEAKLLVTQWRGEGPAFPPFVLIFSPEYILY